MLQSFKLAIKSIWSNKTRSFLTMLGIIIGVSSVIILVGLVNGQMEFIRASYRDMGTNQITAQVVNTPSRSVTPGQMYGFYEENRSLYQQMSPEVPVSGVIKHNTDKLKNTSITGVSEQYMAMKPQALLDGRFLQFSDMEARQPVCVLGYYGAAKLFGQPQRAVGQEVKLNGEILKVVGVLARKDKDQQRAGGMDDLAYIPYTTGVKIMKNADIQKFTFTAADTKNTAKAKEKLSQFLLGIYKSKDLFFVESMIEMLKSMNSTIAMMSATLGGIAGISLLVAGVGVMNIMLVSVTERTREIGIRKSLGAKRRAIMQQFVIEAAVTSSLGGVAGILMGALATPAIGTLIKTKAAATPGAILASFGVSVGIGLVFGYMPASRAAKLNPIEALRSD